MVRILPFGDRALLAEAADSPEALALLAALEASRPSGVIDLVPGARTVLVRVDPRELSLLGARTWIKSAESSPHTPDVQPRTVELGIAYDGPDLADTADLLGVSVEALAARHRATAWTVAFTGFAPGFGYLAGADWPFDVPRLDAPRTRVPNGSVGLAGHYSGAYPRATPGGWRLIGTTDAVLFDPSAAAPALLAPGTRVRFVEAAQVPTPSSVRVQLPGEGAGDSRSLTRRMHSHGQGEAGRDAAAAAFDVVEPGLRATVQDLGRPGRAAIGIAASGALDRTALRAANRLVGNRQDAAGLELTMGGFRAVARRDLWAALAGAWAPIMIDGREVDPYEAVKWQAGAELSVGWPEHGVRTYLAVRGGIDAPAVAGSRSTDTMAGLGPAPLQVGDVVATTDAASGPVPPAEPVMAVPPPDELDLELAPGPRADWFAASAGDVLFDAVWTVSDRADRVGVRLSGPALERVREGELPSEGMVPGAIQVPPDGQPTILLADGPVTGGYPVIAVVADAALDALAQARPGMHVRFRHARPAL